MDIACELCKESFNLDDRVPYTLPCGKTFCYKCVESVTTNKGNIICPIDNTKCPLSSTDLKPNQLLLTLLGNRQAHSNQSKKDKKKFKVVCDSHGKNIDF